MPLYQAIILAIVQGLTEFLPISSTAHLVIIPQLFHWKDPGLAFEVALRVGTLAAVLIFFFKDWVRIVLTGLGVPFAENADGENNRRLFSYLLFGTIPLGIAGLLFSKDAEGPWRNRVVMGIMLIAVGILMHLGDKIKSERGLYQITWPDAAWIALSQAFAVIPGGSRSGITITAGRFRSLDREAAARFSFLLAAPAAAASAAKGALHLHEKGGIPPGMGLPYVVGILVSGLVGILVIAFFLRYLNRNNLSFFVWYRIVFGIIIIALAVFFRTGG